MRKYLCDEYETVALLGSFGKQYDLMIEVAKKLTNNGFDVLVPKLNGIKNDNSGFLILNGDEDKSEELLEDDYLDKCLEADCVYVCNKDGYIGRTVSFELGTLQCYGQEVFFMEKPSDPLIIRLIPPYHTLDIDDFIFELETRNIFIRAFYSDFLDSPTKLCKPFGLIKKRIPSSCCERYYK
jgi:hypothetical protein